MNLNEIKQKLEKRILNWYENDNQRTFIWRKYIFIEDEVVKIGEVKINREFAIFIAEFMLIRTHAEHVEPHYYNFIKMFSSFKEISNAKKNDLAEFFKPLGLLRRINQLMDISKIFSKRKIPRNLAELLKIKGIGLYSASAYLCFTHNQRLPLIDSNFVRIYCRIFGIEENGDLRRRKSFINFCEMILPKTTFKSFNLAILDLGATICLPKPKCSVCPLKDICQYFGFISLISRGCKLINLPFYDKSSYHHQISILENIFEMDGKIRLICSLHSLRKEQRKKFAKRITKLEKDFPGRIIVSYEDVNLQAGFLVRFKLYIQHKISVKGLELQFWKLDNEEKTRSAWTSKFRLISKNSDVVCK